MLWSGRSSRLFHRDGNEGLYRVAGKRSTESSGPRDSVDCLEIPPKDSMNHCVPDWDLEDGIIPSSGFLPTAKGNWESVQQKKPTVMDNEIVELLWENGQVVMQSQANRAMKRMLPVHLSKPMQNDDAVLPGKPYPAVKDNILDSVVHDMAASNASSMHEDEMASWLHYPLDDSLEKEYCSDFFGGMPNSNVHMLRDSVGGQMNSVPAEKASNVPVLKESPLLNDSNSVPRTEFVNMVNSTNTVSSGKVSKEPTSKSVNVDKAKPLGTDRAPGFIPQSGADTFAKFQTTSQSLVSKWHNNAQSSRDSVTDQSSCKKTTQVSVSPLAIPPHKMQANSIVPVKPGMPRLMNFSHFSRPAATVKANLQSIGSGGALLTTERLNRLDKVAVNGNASAEPSIIDSTTTDMTTIEPNKGVNGQAQALGYGQPHQNLLSGKDVDPATCSEDVTDSSAKSQLVCQNSNVDVGDVPEPTVTSSSGGSGNSAGRTGKEANDSSKRKGRDAESSECQSEDAEYESVDAKKQAPRTTTAKRSRAAEVHNQSERRRRDRINERMRALQELIPHCNKSDKASMLDEAIEYLKTLKLQVQIMSMGGGMGIPPVLFPGGMQHFQIPQMAHLSPFGMGMGMGFSMGMVDMGTASGRPVMPLPSVLGPSLPGSMIRGPAGLPMSGMIGSGLPMSRVPGPGLQVSGLPISALPVSGLPGPALAGTTQPLLGSTSAATSTDLQTQMQNANLMDSYKLYLNHQQMQMSPQAMNVNLCNTPMMQQHQSTAQTSGIGGVDNATSGSGSTVNSG